ncbi:cbb3-type cytochrome oxidase assembly protein CcoS [Pleomorphomonas oryzae]|uniref:cbb3-type cytochrome oxidase assembly protein CcoS n=1 Tax=Pleomorphomonas oryzae TaxID=261934 RepID=UPI00041301D1|nr:cbb3-type cytochrome oxidase assembly protein CcoS [Pleomorphomonas oryzae]
MSVLVYLVPAALLLGLLGLAGFMWSLKTGQYEDLEGAAWRILEDDDIEDAPGDGPDGARGRVPEGEERRKG